MAALLCLCRLCCFVHSWLFGRPSFTAPPFEAEEQSRKGSKAGRADPVPPAMVGSMVDGRIDRREKESPKEKMEKEKMGMLGTQIAKLG